MNARTTGGWLESIPAVDIELLQNGNVRVTDKSSFEQDYSVDLHPLHLRLIAEKLGLVPELSASEVEMLRTLRAQKADADRTVRTLVRRLRVLQKRVDYLADQLVNHSDHRHADLSYEMTLANAASDICDEFCADLDDLQERSGNADSVSELTLSGVTAGATPCNATERQVTPSHAREAQPETASLFGGQGGPEQ